MSSGDEVDSFEGRQRWGREKLWSQWDPERENNLFRLQLIGFRVKAFRLEFLWKMREA
jgi:hypothetical protein